MKKIGSFIGLGALLLGAWYLMSKKKVGATAKFSIDKLSISGTNLLLTLGILNPTNTAITIKSILGTLIFKGQDVATVQYFVPKVVAPNGKTQITLTVTPSAVGIITALKSLISKGGLKDLKASFKGNANVDGFLIPIESSYGI